MNIYSQAFAGAFEMLTSGSDVVWQVIRLSLAVSGFSVLIAALAGIPLAYALGISRYAGRGVILVLVNTAMGFPPVVIGLFVYLALSRSGPLGALGWVFTPQGMIVAQVILAMPLVIGISAAAISTVPRDLRTQLRALGASGPQEALAVLKEARGGVMVSVVAAFGAIISEVGAAMMVGGGIEGYTDVMTTAIMSHLRRGEYAAATAWAMVLMGIALFVNIALTTVQNTSSRHGA